MAPATAAQLAARRLGDQPDRGRLGQPHDHRSRHLRQHGDRLHRRPRASPSPALRRAIGANKPTVANSSGTAIAFGTATTISFTAGVATAVSSTKNGVMKLYDAEEARHHRQRRHDLQRRTAGSDRLAADRDSKLGLAAATTTADGQAPPTTSRPPPRTPTATPTTSYSAPKASPSAAPRPAPDGNRPDGLGLLRHRHRLRQRHRDQLQRRRRERLGHEKRRDEALQDRRDHNHGQRRLVLGNARGDGRRAGRQTPARRCHRPPRSPPPPTTSRSPRRTPTNNTATTYTGAKNLTFCGASASPSGAAAHGRQQLRHRDQLRHRNGDQLHQRRRQASPRPKTA